MYGLNNKVFKVNKYSDTQVITTIDKMGILAYL